MERDPHSSRPIHTGDVAVITGAAKRLGRDIALSLASQPGLDVVVHYGRSQEEAEAVVSQIRAGQRRAVAVSADLSDPKNAADTIFAAAESLGTVRLLVNCAAVFDDCPLEDVDEDHWRKQLTINAFAPLLLCQRFASQLPLDITGHIINLLDWRALRPPETHPVYTASKAALTSLTKTLAQQLAPQIQVNGIAPGAMLPPVGDDDWHAERAAQDIPLRHTGCPTDISRAVQYLATSAFVTGEILHVTGGEHL